jgi:hypothetical protein
VGRAEEDRIAATLQEYRAVTLIGPARMGKTWLLQHLRRTAFPEFRWLEVNLSPTRAERLLPPEELLFAVAQRIASEAKLGVSSLRSQRSRPSLTVDGLFDWMEQDVLVDSRPTLLVLDRAEELADLKSGADFFLALRSFIQPGPPWDRLHVALVFRGPSSEAAYYVGNRAPEVPVGEFKLAQIEQYLAKVDIGPSMRGDHATLRLFDFLGGQPILWCLAAAAWRSGTSPDRIIESGGRAPEEDRIFGPHLLWLYERLLSDSAWAGAGARLLRDAVADVLVSRRIHDDEFSALDRLGLVIKSGLEVDFRCRMYRRFAEEVCRRR